MQMTRILKKLPRRAFLLEVLQIMPLSFSWFSGCYRYCLDDSLVAGFSTPNGNGYSVASGLTGIDLKRIDNKMDDGLPLSGIVR